MADLAAHGFLVQIIVALAAAVAFVVLFRLIRLGAILGFLAAGVAIGPAGLDLITDEAAVAALAELGVVFLLFSVGLELPIARIRVTLHLAAGLGVLQIGITALGIAAVAVALGISPLAALVIGGALSLSSTAMVIQLLSQTGALGTRFGRNATGVLIVQDIAVAPMLVLVVILGAGLEGEALMLSLSWTLAKAILVVIAIWGIGRVVLRFVFASVADVRSRDVFAAWVLLIVLAAGLATAAAGLSMAFGAFLAGMLLADTVYRHQVAATIQPFRELLLGTFFISVGMSLEPDAIIANWRVALPLIVGLMAGKAAIIAVLARVFGFDTPRALHLALLLCQAGEFAFVLLGAAAAVGLVAYHDAQQLIVVAGLSMVLTPVLAHLGARIGRRRPVVAHEADVDPESADPELRDHVVIAGFGRVARTVAGELDAAGIAWVAVEQDHERSVEARRAGRPVYYGDAAHPEVLAALHIERARCFVIALDEPRATLQAAALVGYIFPEIEIFARARDDERAEELRRHGVKLVVSEAVPTGEMLARSIRGTPG